VCKLKDERKELQAVMFFLGSISSGMEELVGRPANGLASLAGKKLGVQYSGNTAKTDDVMEAIDITKKILQENGFLWQFEPWKEKETDAYVCVNDDAEKVVKLVFRDCMIRQTLFCYGHPQQQSLCSMMYGFFAGVTEAILGRKSRLNILHAGPNACLKELVIGDKV